MGKSESRQLVRDSFRSLIRRPWTSWVGMRYLKSKKNSRFLSFITSISMVGVGLGVTALIVVLSVMDGFEVEMKKRLRNQEMHLRIAPSDQMPTLQGGIVLSKDFESDPIAMRVRKNETNRNQIEAVFPVLQTEAILRGGKKVTGVTVKGVDSAKIDSLKKWMIESADSPLGVADLGSEMGSYSKIYLGQALADEMDLLPGEFVTLVSPTETDGPFSTIPRLKRFFVAGIFRFGSAEQELHSVFAEMAAVRGYLKKADAITHWEVVLKDFDQAPRIKQKLQADSERLRVQDWQDLNSHLFASLRLERMAMFIALVFIVIVASFNIVTTLTLMVLEKKREISILKAMGARDADIGAVFLSEGLLIGGIGTLGGIFLGFSLCMALKKWEFIQLPEVYFDRTLPVTFLPHYYGIIAFSAFFIVLVASIYPSLRAARIPPIVGIRFGA